jgi:hypothetical protein
VSEWFNAFFGGDFSWLDPHISRRSGVSLIGTDPGEWAEDEGVAHFVQRVVQAIAGTVGVDPGPVHAFREGSVGWTVARPTFILPGGGRVSARWSAIFHEEDGTWKLVHVHASVGIPNENLLGVNV